MMNKYLAVALALVALAGLAWYINANRSLSDEWKPPANVPAPGYIVVQGMMVCLPHKDTRGPQTLECAFGLRDDLGRYFALRDTDPMYRTLSGVPMDKRIEVEGTFATSTSSLYQDIGVIDVTKVTEVQRSGSGSTSGTGIQGHTLLGPTCPVMRDPPDPQCADKPYQTSLAVTSPDGARVVTQFVTDVNGAFTIDLAPGTYAIRSAAAANVLPYCSANTFTVVPGKRTEVLVSCDTGIR